MNIGVLGTGFGAYHAQLLRRINQDGRVVVFGRNEAKLEKLKESLGVEITKEIGDIMGDPGIELVDICLPSPLHKQYAIEALQHGKHVFCETPICFELEDALAMKRAEEQFGKRILVNQFMKFSAGYPYLHDAIRSEKYGRCLSLALKRETPPLWGNLGLATITTNLMIHEFDVLTWLFGGISPLTVWGTESADGEKAQVRAFFQHNDAFLEVMASSIMPEPYPFTVGYEAHFERAKLVFQEYDVHDETIASLHEYTAAGKQELPLEAVNPYEACLRHALQCLRDGSDSYISLDHAIQSLQIALELKASLPSASAASGR